jgi:hypothetical protein
MSMSGVAAHQPCITEAEADVEQNGDLAVPAAQASNLGSSVPSDDHGGSTAWPKTRLQSGIRKPKA